MGLIFRSPLRRFRLWFLVVSDKGEPYDALRLLRVLALLAEDWGEDEARRRSSSYDGVNMKMVDGRLVILGESVFVVFVSVFLDGG